MGTIRETAEGIVENYPYSDADAAVAHVEAALRARDEAASAEIERLRQGLWECAILVGEDIDDRTPHHMTSDLVKYVVDAVREQRKDYDELLKELPIASAIREGED